VTAPPIPRPLARRIDRLSKRAHAFHRFAHHPLCQPYRDEVIRVGKRARLCKGCSLFAAGLVAGLVAGFVVRPPFGWGVCGLLLALGAGLFSLRSRVPKFVGRFLPGAGLGLALCAGWPAATGSLLVLAGLGLLYRRRGVARERCATCREQSASPCSGFARIVRRERAFQRVANRWQRDLPRSVA
jgi:hypothetical protein